MSTDHHTINYIEIVTTDLGASKAFYAAAFGWAFVDYGPNYAAFTGAGIDGGLEHVSQTDRTPSNQGALVILYSDDLNLSVKAIEAAGGIISKPVFSFPGGSRFHFTDPSGNELAVWKPAAD